MVTKISLEHIQYNNTFMENLYTTKMKLREQHHDK